MTTVNDQVLHEHQQAKKYSQPHTLTHYWQYYMGPTAG